MKMNSKLATDLNISHKTTQLLTLPAVQRLRLCASTAGGTGSIPGQGSCACHAVQRQCPPPKKKPIKLSIENRGANLCDLALGKVFLDVTSKTQTTREKNTQISLYQIKKPLFFKGHYHIK